MSKSKKPANEPVDARIRLEIARWPDDAPRGAITSFCREHEISTQTFHRIRRVALNEGQAAALAPKSRSPKTRPSAVGQDTKVLAVNTRAALRDSGLDYGPISVRHKMVAIGAVMSRDGLALRHTSSLVQSSSVPAPQTTG